METFCYISKYEFDTNFIAYFGEQSPIEYMHILKLNQ